jgi:hypothetical protein
MLAPEFRSQPPDKLKPASAATNNNDLGLAAQSLLRTGPFGGTSCNNTQNGRFCA